MASNHLNNNGLHNYADLRISIPGDFIVIGTVLQC